MQNAPCTLAPYRLGERVFSYYDYTGLMITPISRLNELIGDKLTKVKGLQEIYIQFNGKRTPIISL
ncbi:hypothetical protein GCM10022289_22300 [Pedobacter jeongneungensis]|uniref:YD repeat-containing protein n=1 Tax=Pedobacter jeongneungensis TaxID=947309 RepID=A0ABP8BDQ4_9SPHI